MHIAHRFIALSVVAILTLLVATAPASAQNPAPAAPTNLTVELTDTEGEVQLNWDEADGATAYRVCNRVQNPAGSWSCISRSTTSAKFTGLTVGTTYDFAVASYNGREYSSWVWAELTIRGVSHAVCPITGMAIPEGYLSVNQKTTSAIKTEFTLSGITRKSTVRLGDNTYRPLDGRAYVSVCGRFKNGSNSAYAFLAGFDNNLATDAGIGFRFLDDGTTEWHEIGKVPAGDTKTACDIWDVAEDATTVIYTVNNWNDTPGVYRVDLP